MHFLDGNDPTKAPGAVLYYPVADADFVFDETRKAVVNRKTGERLNLRITDREYRSFESVILETVGGPVTVVQGYLGRTKKPDFGSTRAYNIIGVFRFEAEGPRRIDYHFNVIAKFLNAYPDPFGEHQFTGHVAVIDNRSRGCAPPTE